MSALFRDPAPDVSNHLLAGWFATTAGGFLFRPVAAGEPYVYQEVGGTG
jgi:hypothetical protein